MSAVAASVKQADCIALMNQTVPKFGVIFDGYGSEASPALSLQNGDPYIYITTDTANGAAYCFDKDGNAMWEYVADYPEYILQGVAISDGRVFFGNDAGYLYALGSWTHWDVNCDSSTNALDMIMVSQYWGEGGTPGWLRGDVNRDGAVNVLDMILIGQHWTG